VAFSPDGRQLVSASFDKEARLWDATPRQEPWDHTVKVWDVDPKKKVLPWQSREVKTLRGHRDRVHGVAFSPDGTLLASAGDDKTVRVWNVATGKEVMAPLRHRPHGPAVAFDPDGRRVATGCWSASSWLKTWNVEGPGRPRR
jgi:WD40 repeat protein